MSHFVYDPTTLSPLKVTCKDDGSKYPIEFIEKSRGPIKDKKKLQFLVHWIDYDEPTWEPWENADVRNTFALYYFLKNHPNESFRQMIPKNIRNVNSGEEVESS
jgi:hypothetical protein